MATPDEDNLTRDFDEDSVYERLVLHTFADAEEAYQGTVTDVYDLRYTPPSRLIGIVDTDGAGAVVQALRKFHILLFAVAYKALDLLVEFILRLNQFSQPNGRWTFADKKKEVARLQGQILILPQGLCPYPQIWERLARLYINLLEARHSVVHRRATVGADGTFHVQDQTGNPLRPITQEERASFAFVMLDVLSLVLKRAPDNRVANAVTARLDRLEPHHGLPLTGATVPTQVLLILKVPLESVAEGTWRVDVKHLREYVARLDTTAVADLHLHRPGEPARAFVARLDELNGDALEFAEDAVPLLLSRVP